MEMNQFLKEPRVTNALMMSLIWGLDSGSQDYEQWAHWRSAA